MNLYSVPLTVQTDRKVELVGLVRRVRNLPNLGVVLEEPDQPVFATELELQAVSLGKSFDLLFFALMD